MNKGKILSSSEKISALLALLEHVRRIDLSCKEIATNKEMSYFTNNIKTYLEGIVGIIETDIKETLMAEFLEGNEKISRKGIISNCNFHRDVKEPNQATVAIQHLNNVKIDWEKYQELISVWIGKEAL